MLPRLIINYKTYDEGLGENSLRISRAAKEIKDIYSVDIAVMPSFVDLRENAKIIKVYSQTLEPIKSGSNTGHITLNQILDVKAKGVVLNHSEKRISLEEIIKTSEMAKENALDVIVCVENWKEAKEIDKIESIDAIALEPKELIGSGRAVSKEKPEEIEKALSVVKKPLYVGAGITNKEDVEKSIELGSYGVLVASSIVKAKDVKEKIKEIASPFASI